MKVLLPLDRSNESKCLICEVLARPWPAETEFCVLHVVDIAGLGRFGGLVEERNREGQAIVGEAAERLANGGKTVRKEVLAGFPRKTVVQYAKEWAADWIMVGSHGQGPVARLLLGSVAGAVLHRAHCSVEIVRRKKEPKTRQGRGMRIVFGTDGSESAARAADSVAQRPWPAETEVFLVSAVDLLIPGYEMTESISSPVYPASLLEEVWEESRRRAKEAAHSAQEKFLAAGLKVGRSEAMPLGDARVTLLEQARLCDADLIVVGSHGRSGVDYLLLGSVSEFVALHAPCSVEIIRSGHAGKAGAP